MMQTGIFLVLLAACGGKESSSGGDTAGQADARDGIAGQYQFIPSAATGCTVGEGENAVSEDFWVVNWADGMLKIDGDPDTATFIFPRGGTEGYAFPGSILSGLTFSFYGDVIFEGEVDRGLGPEPVMARLTAEGVGSAENDGGCWQLSGDMKVVVDEDDDQIDVTNCTLEVPFIAAQLSGDNCDGLQ